MSVIKIPKANSGIPEHKNRKKNTGTSIFFSFKRLWSKLALCNLIPQLFL